MTTPKLTTQQQAQLFVGKDNWHTFGIKDILPSLFMTDGPNGLRIETETGLGFNPSKEAIAYPTASAVGCSFDRDLLYRFGAYLAKECQQEHINILLGPGVNHKRSPLCGRNFEYFSEDPILTSELASAYINGLQDHGIGASLKHFAVNSREMSRLVQDSIIDKRALFEIYLRQFERIIKKSHPWTIMAAYNLVNGKHCTENSYLLQDILRKKWNYEGVVLSDWGAVSDPVQALKNGLNLEMPGGDHGSSSSLLQALNQNELSLAQLNQNTEYLQDLIRKCSTVESTYQKEEHLAFAQEVSEKSSVLLKNNGALPLHKDESIALIGAFAKSPRHQGTGSSKVHCTSVDSIYETLTEKQISFDYAQGYHTSIDEVDPLLLEQAKYYAKKNKKVILVLGLPDGKEAEGYDRKDLDLPKCQISLLSSLYEVNKNIIVVLECGSPIVMPWINQVNALLLSYLSGCRGGHAQVRLLYGDVNPSGKLAESFPLHLKDVPCLNYYHNSLYQTQYRESIFTGYRYYDTFEKPVLFPFGYGLSYTSFSYKNLEINKDNTNLHLSFTIQNTGSYSGREIYQVYVGMKDSKIARARIELKQFGVISLDASQKEMIELSIPLQDLTYYDTKQDDWILEEGTYQIYVGSSSKDLHLQKEIFLEGELNPYSSLSKDFIHDTPEGVIIKQEDFKTILGYDIPPIKDPYPFTRDSTISDLKITRFGRILIRRIQKALKKRQLKDASQSMVFESPIRMMLMASRRITWNTVDEVVSLLNGHWVGSIHRILKSLKKKDRK